MPLHARGPRAILVTSLRTQETPQDCIDLLVSERERPVSAAHAAAADLGQRRGRRHRRVVLRAISARANRRREALKCAASSVFGILARTAEKGAREILLVEAQEELVKPSRVFEPEPVG